jgi:hypothetical protein
LETTVLKLALICAVLAGSSDRIDLQSMKAAVVLGDYFVQANDFMFRSGLALTRIGQAKQKVVKLLEGAGEAGLLRSRLMTESQMYKKDLDAVMETLIEEGRVTKEVVRQGMSGRGRPGIRYRSVPRGIDLS